MIRSARFLATALMGLLLFADGASAQTPLKDRLVGAWSFVSTLRPDGGSAWGADPKGLLVFTAGGRFSIQVMRSDRPKFAANNRMQGTAEENKAALNGLLAYFGTYQVDEAARTLTFNIESSSFPNWNGTSQRRSFTVTADELAYDGPPAPGDRAPSQVKWRRAE